VLRQQAYLLFYIRISGGSEALASALSLSYSEDVDIRSDEIFENIIVISL